MMARVSSLRSILRRLRRTPSVPHGTNEADDHTNFYDSRVILGVAAPRLCPPEHTFSNPIMALNR